MYLAVLPLRLLAVSCERAVVMDAAERRKVSLMQALSTIRNEKVAIRKESAQRRKEVSAAQHENRP